MKWFVVGVLVSLAKFGEGGALRCAPGVEDPSCTTELEKGPEPQLKQGRSCEPGTSWKSQCNDCACSPNGLPFCTDKACIALGSEPEKLCAPESRWKNECNSCFCTPNGIPSCTRMGCLHFEPTPAPEKPDNEGAPGVDDEYDYDDYLEDYDTDYSNGENNVFDYLTKPVNADFNFEDQVLKANQNLVQIERSIEDSDINLEEPYENHIQDPNDVKDKSHNVLKRSQVCKPSQVFQSECNTCKCASDGQSYSCTQNECMEGEMNKEVEVFMETEGEDHIERHSVCKPRGTFYIGCNTCHCNLYGTDYSCTNKPCPLPEDVELFHELKDMKPIIPYTNEGGKKSNSTQTIGNKPKI